MQNITTLKNKPKVVVGMSGGVDSSVALMLLKKQGYEPIGVSLKLPVWKNKSNCLKENVCCTQESFKIAKDICKKMGVKHYIVNASKDFKDEVISYFVEEYKNNRTPNPCVICNRVLKFQKLFEQAKIYGADFVATGHYAKIVKNKNGQYELQTAIDKNKDQTYSLSNIKKEWLGKIIFPLSNLTKDKVYKIAKEQGFDYFDKTKQSQDFCFVANKSFDDFLAKEIGKLAGSIVDTKGKILGRHNGLHFYTIGQRKGIGLSGGPYFVVGTDFVNNLLIVSTDIKDCSKKEILLDNCNFLADFKMPILCNVKIRARSELIKAKLYKIDDPGMCKIEFVKLQEGVTPGQYCVFYKGKTCLGNGRIRNF
jgi:tRNA-specific 2-thiouridylase